MRTSARLQREQTKDQFERIRFSREHALRHPKISEVPTTATIPGSVLDELGSSSDMLEEVPREHVIKVLELCARIRLVPPVWAVRRYGEYWVDQRDSKKTAGHPRTNALVDRIRAIAVEKCAKHKNGRGDKYERADRLLRTIPAELYCGMHVIASAERLKKSYWSVVGRHRRNLWTSDEQHLRSLLPLLIEAIDRRTTKTGH